MNGQPGLPGLPGMKVRNNDMLIINSCLTSVSLQGQRGETAIATIAGPAGSAGPKGVTGERGIPGLAGQRMFLMILLSDAF